MRDTLSVTPSIRVSSLPSLYRKRIGIRKGISQDSVEMYSYFVCKASALYTAQLLLH